MPSVTHLLQTQDPILIAHELNHKQNFDSVTEGIQEHDTPDGLLYMWLKEKREIKCIRLHYDLDLQQ